MNRNQQIKRAAMELLFVTLWALRRVLRLRRMARLLELAILIALVLTALSFLHRWLQPPESAYPEVPTALEVWQRERSH